MVLRQTTKLVATDRTEWWRAIGFGLGATFHALAEQFLHITCGLLFEMAQVLVAG
jgi:hypothetical protein